MGGPDLHLRWWPNRVGRVAGQSRLDIDRDAEIDQLLPELADLHPREPVPSLTAAVVTASHGELEDAATVLGLDWYGGRTRTRDASSGATNDRASI